VSLTVFEALVIVPTLGSLAFLAVRQADALRPELIYWAVIVAFVELLPVPAWRGLQMSMGFPLLIGVGFLYEAPIAAALTALVGSFDPREFRREVGVLRALFNRCQVARSVFAASWVFHFFASIDTSPTWVLVASAMLAAIADYLVNSSIVTIGASIQYQMVPSRVIRELRIGRFSEFLVSYLGLGVLGLALAQFYNEVGFWSVPIFVLPLLLARQMFFRSRALEEAHKELQDREQVLRALSNRMAEERQDERAQIAAYLHDDLAQLLFRLSIQVDIARRHLAAGKLDATEQTLDQIKDTKARTSDRIRVLIRDLHRSPLGRAGLAEALHGFIAETARDSDVRFHTDIDELPLPPPIALLVYHIAREGVMNALKHARASNFWLTVKEDGDVVELVLQDDGAGFDSQAPGPEGHYGLTMMRERAVVGGGSFDLKSAVGEGTSITVRFPTSWLQQAENELPPPAPETDGEPATEAHVDASLDTRTPEEARKPIVA
jgi:signal transduction histidine kinase